MVVEKNVRITERFFDNHYNKLIEPILKMRLSARGCVPERIKLLTYYVYAPLLIRSAPGPGPLATIFEIGSI